MQKKALLVGVNRYPNPSHRLRGCVNDVRQIQSVLEGPFAFGAGDGVRLLTDARASTEAIRAGLSWLVSDSAPGDVLVFHYSGHGSQVADRNGDEVSDGLDETLCPYDFDWDHPFTDDELDRFAGRVAPGASLTVILDCCHSGTGLRVPPLRPLAARCLEPPLDLGHRVAPDRRGRLERGLRRFGRRSAEAGALLLSACRDDQVSADAYIDGDYHGAATYFFCQAMSEANYRLTYRQLVNRARRLLGENQFDQVPQLEGPPEMQRQPVFSPIGATVVA